MKIERDKNDSDFFHVLYPWKTIAKEQNFSLLGTLHSDALEDIFGIEVSEDLNKLNKGQGMEIKSFDSYINK